MALDFHGSKVADPQRPTLSTTLPLNTDFDFVQQISVSRAPPGRGAGRRIGVAISRMAWTSGAGEDDSEQMANADALESDRERGVGEIRIDGNAVARAGGKIKLIGARPGVDGDYLMDLVTHDFDASKGWVTTIKVKRPETKTDSRGAWSLPEHKEGDTSVLPQ